MEEKNGNGKTILIATLVIIIVGLIGFIVYDKCFNKEAPSVKPEEQKEEKKEEKTTKEAYHLVDGETFDVYGMTSGEDTELTKRDKTISFVYPVFDIDSDDAKEANAKIKEKYDTAYKTNLESEIDENGCIAIKKDGKYYGGSHIYSFSYNVSNNDKFISIALTENQDTECAGGYHSYYGFVIDKTTKKAMTNKELITYFGGDETNVINIYNRNADTFNYKKATTIDEVELVVIDGSLNVVCHGNGDELELVK